LIVINVRWCICSFLGVRHFLGTINTIIRGLLKYITLLEVKGQMEALIFRENLIKKKIHGGLFVGTRERDKFLKHI
jgi:hypothetical protein